MASIEPYYLKYKEGDEKAKKRALRYMVQYRTPDRKLTKSADLSVKVMHKILHRRSNVPRKPVLSSIP